MTQLDGRTGIAAFGEPARPPFAARRQLQAGMIGNVLEYYDFLVYALVAFNRPNAKTHSGVWRDLAVRKRQTEVDLQMAPIVKIGRSHGIACDKLNGLVTMIHEIENGSRTLSDDNLIELTNG